MKNMFIPFKRYGDFILDDDIAKYANILSAYKYEAPDEYGDEYYYSPDYKPYYTGHSLMVIDKKIRSVFCHKEVIYNNTNLINLSIDEFQNITNSKYVDQPDEFDIFENEPPEYAYEFDDIGAQVWTHYGRVVTIIVSGYWSYEDD